MERNVQEINLFEEKLFLSERIASDVLSFSEFVRNSGDEKTIGLALYQASLIVESSLKFNKKELPRIEKLTLIKKVLKFFGIGKSYKQHLSDTNDVINFNQKLTAKYLLDNLTQKEIFDLVKKIYKLEGIDTENQVEIKDQKKN